MAGHSQATTVTSSGGADPAPRLPDGLLVILHLHLLGFPLRAAAGLDERLFDATRRGMHERAKALEDIAFFLVGRIEGARERAKAVSVLSLSPRK